MNHLPGITVPVTGHNRTGYWAFNSIPFMALEDPPKNPIHQSFIGEKGKILTHVVYVEWISGDLTKTNITSLSDALNEVNGILTVFAQYIFRDDHHVTD